MILVTGGAGFIGANFVLMWVGNEKEPILNLDKLTYAGNKNNLVNLENNFQHIFIQSDINNQDLLATLFREYKPRAVVHFAAETHVDRSIYEPEEFIKTNINGTFCLLKTAYSYWTNLTAIEKAKFRFLHVSTDEVYGSLEINAPAFSETKAYAPNSPYAASKAASDHLVRAYHQTYGLPTLTTNCSNNYGPYQFPEKLIPLTILNAIQGRPLSIYGDGLNVRDWLFVSDHCEAMRLVLEKGKVGETYNIGAWNEKTNLEVVRTVCTVLDELRPSGNSKSYAELITFIKDRPGHDRRYAIDATKIKRELGWEPKENFTSGICKTVAWYLANRVWVNSVQSGEYQNWLKKNYHQRGA